MKTNKSDKNLKSFKKRKLEMLGISKSFPGVKAVTDVDLTLESGSIHAIVGENGAGKTTLMNILFGKIKRDSGIIKLDGKEIYINEPIDAKRRKITMVAQEFSLLPDLNVYQNIFLGREHSYSKTRFILNWNDMKKEADNILTSLGFKIDLDLPIKRLATYEQQIIEIIKAIWFGAEFIIMDEPTSALGEDEKEKFFKILKNLREKGVGILYISHRIEEIFEIADYVTVMRDSKKVGTYKISETDEPIIVKLMVGRRLSEVFFRDRKNLKIGEKVLEVKNLTKRGVFENISFNVRSGEVVGLSGLMGSRRTQIVKCIFGLNKFDSGEIYLNGKKVRFNNTHSAIKNGVCMVPGDRKREGIIPDMVVKDNITIAALPKISRFGWIKKREESELASNEIKALDIKVVSTSQLITQLSGGNMQKVVLGRVLALNPKLLILNEPTRGIDIGTKSEVHKLISKISKSGVAIIMISSELPEILGGSDRIIVFSKGKIKNEYDYKNATQEKIIVDALG